MALGRVDGEHRHGRLPGGRWILARVQPDSQCGNDASERAVGIVRWRFEDDRAAARARAVAGGSRIISVRHAGKLANPAAQQR